MANGHGGLLAPQSRPIALWVPLVERSQAVGVMGLGPRWTGEVYDEQDRQLIGILARQMALAIDASAGKPTSKKGKTAVIGTACSTPWPFNFIAAESRGAIRAVREVLHYGGYKILGTVIKPGSKSKPEVSDKLLEKARSIGKRV